MLTHKDMSLVSSTNTDRVKKKATIQVSHLTRDTKLKSDKNTKKNHTQEPRGQPFPSR